MEKYKLIIKEIDKRCEYLNSLHSKHLQCKKGCDLCCMDYRIFPVEFYSILNQLQKDKTFKKPINKKDKSHCIFLRDHSCSIYENRPVICRTHGLPLLYVNEDNEWELSNCELNFKEYNFNDFNTGNTFTMDKYNSKIFVLNRKFIHSFTERTFKETDLIPLRKLAEHLE